MSSNARKSPKRSPRSSPKPKTPVIKSINVDLVETLNDVKDALPAPGISTLGLKSEDVQIMIDYPNILRGILLICAIVTYVLSLVFYMTGHVESKKKSIERFGNKIPFYVFDPWFAVILLTATMAGIVYVLFSINHFSFFFTAAVLIFFFAMVMVSVKFYYDLKVNSTATQIYGFILFAITFIFAMIITQETNNFLFSLFALLPALIFSGYMIYCGGVLNTKN